jgi:FkbM family methyltransferase
MGRQAATESVARGSEAQTVCPEKGFLPAFLKEVLADCYRVQENNLDAIRFPQQKQPLWARIRHQLKDAVVRHAAAHNFIYANSSEAERYAVKLESILSRLQEYQGTYALLADQASRDLMVKLLAYRVLGGNRVRLPTNNAHYWKAVASLGRLVRKRAVRDILFSNWHLHLFDLEEIGFPVRLIAHDLTVLDTFLLEQYRFNRADKVVEVEPGDVVIDAGGGWGDTALYAACRTGEKGAVFCFEFLPDNLSILEENLALNLHLKDKISIVQEAAWDRSGENLSFVPQGPGTHISLDETDGPVVQTRAIDDFVRQRELERVDFVKMDIEGAELKALQGAQQTLRMFRPKLAISLYHRNEDFYAIPRYLNDLGIGYKFYLDHSSIHREETMLFAIATDT